MNTPEWVDVTARRARSVALLVLTGGYRTTSNDDEREAEK